MPHSSQHLGIDRIGLSQIARSSGEVPRAGRVDPCISDALCIEYATQMHIVVARRLEDGKRLRPVLQAVRKRAGGLRAVWKALRPPALTIKNAKWALETSIPINPECEACPCDAGSAANSPEQRLIIIERAGPSRIAVLMTWGLTVSARDDLDRVATHRGLLA